VSCGCCWTGELCEAPPEAGDVDGASSKPRLGPTGPVCARGPRLPGMSTEEPDLSSGGAAEAGADNGAETEPSPRPSRPVLTVATDPVPPGLLAELWTWRSQVEHVRSSVAGLAASYEADVEASAW